MVGPMSDHLHDADPNTIGELRSMARQGCAPSAMMRRVQQKLGHGTPIVTVLNYFRQAFCLSLAEAKAIAALSRNESRSIDDESQLDHMLLPAIQSHRCEWEK
jgi:hypothetical protein